MSGFLMGIAMIGGMSRMAVVGFVELLGAIRPFELVTFAGDAHHCNGQKKQGKKFHRSAS